MVLELSNSCKSLWAKLSKSGDGGWLPLHVHMSDTCGVALKIWDEWLSRAAKDMIIGSVKGVESGQDARGLLAFLSASHDLGKASPPFQLKADSNLVGREIIKRIEESGLTVRKKISEPDAFKHATVSELILQRHGIDVSVADIVGGHHGVPPSKKDLVSGRVMSHPNNTGFDDERWMSTHDELLSYVCSISGFDLEALGSVRIDAEGQVLLTSVVIMADWIASNEIAFPLIDTDRLSVENEDERVEMGWRTMALERYVEPHTPRSFESVFGFEPRPFQRSVVEASELMDSPGIMIIEAPTGEGKTEAALAAAEVIGSKFGLKGLFFALPTQATADGIMDRVRRWVPDYGEGRTTFFLSHGKARFNEAYRKLPREGWGRIEGSENGVVVHEWLTGKKGILSDVVVGTVDQVLMAGLKGRHLALRHLGLAEKVVVIDECHAYDEYMGSYLEKTLSWLGAYGVPVVLMSATLPPNRRRDLVAAYTGGGILQESADPAPYPMITAVTSNGTRCFAPEQSGRRMIVEVRRLPDELVAEELETMAAEGGYVGIIVNTVSRAQQYFDRIRAAFPDDDVRLLHSGFMCSDRMRHESNLMTAVNAERKRPPYRMFVIGTQVIEQSLDLDFDVLVTDECPIDLLIQRIGRLHRHENPRPQRLRDPICMVITPESGEFDRGSIAVYGKYQLMNTRQLLGDSLDLPGDVPSLVAAAYDPSGLTVPKSLRDEYDEAMSEMKDDMRSKEKRARVFQIGSPSVGNLIGWLDYPPNEEGPHAGEALVRDTDGSVEAILVVRRSDGTFAIPTWVDGCGGRTIPTDSVPDDETASAMSGCLVKIPRRLFGARGIKGVESAVKELERISRGMPARWSESAWLSDSLYLPIDEEGRTRFMEKDVRYDPERGICTDERCRIQSA